MIKSDSFSQLKKKIIKSPKLFKVVKKQEKWLNNEPTVIPQFTYGRTYTQIELVPKIFKRKVELLIWDKKA